MGMGSFKDWFSFRRGTIPLSHNNLARALVNRHNPVFDTLGFSQFQVRQLLRETQPPQLFVNQAAPVSGVGGLIQGNIVYQSLGPNPNPNQ